MFSSSSNRPRSLTNIYSSSLSVSSMFISAFDPPPSETPPPGREKHLLSGSPEGPLSSPLNSSDSGVTAIPPRGESPSLFLKPDNLHSSQRLTRIPSESLKGGSGEREERESEACGICLTGTCLYRPVPFQFKRPLSWEQQLNIILCEEKKKRCSLLLLSQRALPTLQGRFAASVSSFG